MKKALLIISVVILAGTANARDIDIAYDSTLAKSLGADDYGMKMYVFVMLKTGNREVTDQSVRDSLFRGHLANISRLADMGKLIVAGPLGRNELNYRGIFIFDASMEEVEKLLLSDPAIKAGVLRTEIFPWYGSAALPVYLETHKKIEKKKP